VEGKRRGRGRGMDERVEVEWPRNARPVSSPSPYPSVAAWESLPFFRFMAPSSRETPWAKPVRAESEEAGREELGREGEGRALRK
jgi:hypothetical protein